MSGFRLTLSPGSISGAGPKVEAEAEAEAEAARVEEEVSLDPEARRVSVVRRAGGVEQKSFYRAQIREGRTWLLREWELSGPREDLLRNDSLRGRLAASLAVDLLAWGRMR